MFSPIRLMRLEYIAGLPALMMALSAPGASYGQVPALRAPSTPLLGSRPTTPALSPLNPAVNANLYANSLASISLYNAAVLGQSLSQQANLNTPATALANSYLAASSIYGANNGPLAATTGGSNLGYNSVLNGGGYGGYGSSAYGSYATQWLMNPYEGYLTGAASLTTANAQYQTTIQQARLSRQEAIRSAIQTRRAAIEEAEYERAHMADAEKNRQQLLARELDRARVSPPLTEVWSGKSLNTLLRNAIAQQTQGGHSPSVPLNEDTLRSINLTAGDTRGNAGLLRNNGNLDWPPSLSGEAFKESRENLSRRMKQAVSTAKRNHRPDESTIRDLQADLKRLKETLDAGANQISADQYIEARRFLTRLGQTVTTLRDHDVSNHFNGNWRPRGRNVAELVQFMTEKGLSFAPAAPSDEPAYLALYHAFVAFDAGMPRPITSGLGETGSGNSEK